jgi:hypothetical protein
MLTLEYNMIGRYEVNLNDTPYAPSAFQTQSNELIIFYHV